jgi:hypothetical protein
MIASGYAGCKANTIVDIEERRDDALLAAQHRAQAGHVSAWASADVEKVGMRSFVSVAVTAVAFHFSPCMKCTSVSRRQNADSSTFVYRDCPLKNRRQRVCLTSWSLLRSWSRTG